MAKSIFRIEIELGNDAMRTDAHIAQKLRELAKTSVMANLANNGEERKIRDANGNTVGKWGFYAE